MRPAFQHTKIMLSAGGVLVLCLFFYLLFQNPTAYRLAGSHLFRNFYYKDNVLTKGKVPFGSYDESNMLHWDAEIYMQIRNHGYDTESAGGDYIFAFFPLFPLVWRITQLSPTAMVFFNYFLYAMALLFLISRFHSGNTEKKSACLVIAICTPMLAVFLIPYSEGLFMFTATFALWGMYKKKYLLYFTAALCMSLTRSAASIISIALLITELYFWFKHRHSRYFLRSFALNILPIATGIAIVSLIQYNYGSESFLKFIEVQKYWGFHFQIPGQLSDWSHEQFGSNVSLLMSVLPASIVYLAYHAVKNIFHPEKVNLPELTANAEYRKEYLFVFSLLYMTGMVLSILFFRDSSLNGISRFVLCTPFYFIALFLMKEKLTQVSLPKKTGAYMASLIATVLMLSFSGYSDTWNFSNLGFLLFYLQLAFFVFVHLAEKRWLIVCQVILTALWTSYLFNIFISDAWLFT